MGAGKGGGGCGDWCCGVRQVLPVGISVGSGGGGRLPPQLVAALEMVYLEPFAESNEPLGASVGRGEIFAVQLHQVTINGLVQNCPVRIISARQAEETV